MNNVVSIKILLIEDNSGDIRLIREMLDAEKGYTLVCANMLSSGLKRTQRGDIDVVLLDLSLPDSDGIESLHKVLAQVPGVPIIVITGTEDDHIAKNAVEKGASGYLVKGSIDSYVLSNVIKSTVIDKACSRTA